MPVEVKRNADGIPMIEFPWPPCPVCGEGLDYDGDGWDCSHCQVGWDRTGVHGRWQSDKPACGEARHVVLYPASRATGAALGDLTQYAVCHLDDDHVDQQLPHAGFDPADVTEYSGPTDWVRWDADGERVW